MIAYHIGAIVKIFFGILILLALYNYIDPYQDMLLAMSLGLLGIFIVSWGLSFYVFYGIHSVFSTRSLYVSCNRSYILSMLFGMYVLINMAFVLMETWNKFVGLVILIFFIFFQALIFFSYNKK